MAAKHGKVGIDKRMQINPNRLMRRWIGLICIVEMEWGPNRPLRVQFGLKSMQARSVN